MTDDAHVQTKSAQSLADGRCLTVIQTTNPTSKVSDYRTALDPSLVLIKPGLFDTALLDLSDEPVPLWYSSYATGISEAEIYYKMSILSEGRRQMLVGDSPFICDIGPVADLPEIEDSNLADDYHKIVVTDVAPIDTLISSGITVPNPTMFNLMVPMFKSQFFLYPQSSRHIVKTSDGIMHAVVCYTIDSLSRVVYLKSINGGVSWTSTIIDNDDNVDYVLPSITCDSDNNIYITYTRWYIPVADTYWLFCGTTIPDGFELISGSGGIAYHKMLVGGDGSYSTGDPDDPEVWGHDHSSSAGDGSLVGGSCRNLSQYYANRLAARCSWHHSEFVYGISPVIALPRSKSLKLIRYHGFPPSLPVDIIVMFDTTSLPTGYTRYTAQDNRYIYLSDDVGTSVGASVHSHEIPYTISGLSGYLLESGQNINVCMNHSHSGTWDSTDGDSSVPGHGVVLAKVTSARASLPEHAIIMTDYNGILLSSGFTDLSSDTKTLHDLYIAGKSSYASISGDVVHSHPKLEVYTATGENVYQACYTTVGASFSYTSHYHYIEMYFGDGGYDLPRFCPRMYHVDSDFDLITVGCDMFYRTIDSSGTISDPVNVTEDYESYPRFDAICLADSPTSVHFIYSTFGINTTPNRSRICYRHMSSGVIGAVEYPSTDDAHCIHPSIDVDLSGNVHLVWSEFDQADDITTTNTKIRYCKRTSGSWGSVEDVDTSARVGLPSNVITDPSNNVYILYCYWSDAVTRICDIYYSKRTTTWSTPVNLSPGKTTAGYNQLSGQIYLDNKGNVIFTWSGKGYGAHASVYHPVYRYLTPSGTIVPATTSDAVDFFPDDDHEIILPAVFWHAYPLVDSVRHNLMTAGFAFLYLYDVHGTDEDVSDLKFYASDDALVGDCGPVGQGGSGDGEFSPGGISAESLLQFESFSTNIRGYVNNSAFNQLSGGPVA